MTKEITFIAAFDIDREVTISPVTGNLSFLHIYIDRYYKGSIGQISGEWVIQLNEDTEKSKLKLNFKLWFGVADKDAILDRMIEAGWI